MVKEGTRYRKKEKKDKEFFSVRSLVEEITGVSELEDGFENAYKTVQRIVATMQSTEGVDKGKLKIQKTHKESFVKSVKMIFEDEKFKKIMIKMRDRKDLTMEESLIWIQAQFHCLAEGQSEEIKSRLMDQLEKVTEVKFFERVQKILDLVHQDTNLAQDIHNTVSKLEFLDIYLQILEDAFKPWRTKLQLNLLWQNMMEEVVEEIIEENPHLKISEKGDEADKYKEIHEIIMKQVSDLSE